jgi:hypothetical protein
VSEPAYLCLVADQLITVAGSPTICGTSSCDFLADVRVHWPSGPVEVCPRCANKLVAVAEALGTHVHVEQTAESEHRYELARMAADDATAVRGSLLELD